MTWFVRSTFVPSPFSKSLLSLTKYFLAGCCAMYSVRGIVLAENRSTPWPLELCTLCYRPPARGPWQHTASNLQIVGGVVLSIGAASLNGLPSTGSSPDQEEDTKGPNCGDPDFNSPGSVDSSHTLDRFISNVGEISVDVVQRNYQGDIKLPICILDPRLAGTAANQENDGKVLGTELADLPPYPGSAGRYTSTY